MKGREEGMDITGNKKIEEELRDALREWDIIFNSITDLIFVQAKDNTIIKANKAFVEAFHKRPEELIGRKCYEVLHKLGAPWPGCPLEKTKIDKKPHTEEVDDLNIGRCLLITTSPILDQKGELTGAVHIATDISERKEAEDKYRTLVSNINVGIYRNTAGPRGRFLQVNHALVKMFGYDSIEEFLAVDAAEHYYNPAERELFVKEISVQGSIKDKEIRFKKKDGTPIMVSVTAKIHYDKNGGIEWIDGMVEDITERKKAEEELRESEIKYKTLFDSSADAIMLLTPERGFFSGNKATIKMFGCKDEEEFTTKSPADLSPEYQPDGSLSTVKAQEMMAIAIEKGYHYFEWTHRRFDGTDFFTTVLLTRINLRGKELLQCTIRDITQQKLIEEELKKRLVDLERFQRITVDRELKMKELKTKIAQLEAKSGQA